MESGREVPTAPQPTVWFAAAVPKNQSTIPNRDRWWGLDLVCWALEFIFELIIAILT